MKDGAESWESEDDSDDDSDDDDGNDSSDMKVEQKKQKKKDKNLNMKGNSVQMSKKMVESEKRKKFFDDL